MCHNIVVLSEASDSSFNDHFPTNSQRFSGSAFKHNENAPEAIHVPSVLTLALVACIIYSAKSAISRRGARAVVSLSLSISIAALALIRCIQ